MTRKQIRKFADKITEQELIVRNPASSKEAKSRAENRIIQLSGMLACLPDGLDVMTEIDELIQKKIADIENKKEIV